MKKTIALTVFPGNERREFAGPLTLAEALFEMGRDIPTPCGGSGTCGKCLLRAEGELSPRSESEIARTGSDAGLRLSCQAELWGEVRVYLHEAVPTRNIPPASLPTGDEPFALAVDIGTTSIQISLVNRRGETYPADSFLNPQRKFGHDVISRVAHARQPSGRHQLVEMLRRRIDGSLANRVREWNLNAGKVERIVFSGNTAMLYFLFDYDVTPLGVAPYQIKDRSFEGYTAADIGMTFASGSEVVGLPVVSAFLGGDFSGGLGMVLAGGISERCFFIDLGTNGEMFLMDADAGVHATSCAMGPALEGMNMQYGMTAVEGALTHVFQEGAGIRYQVLGGGSPVGISGTGYMDLVAMFLEEEIIANDGSLRSERGEGDRRSQWAVVSRDGQKRIELGSGLALTQKDLRSLQLAKGASYAASRLLLREAHCREEDIRHVFIAGAFGENLNLDHFRRLKFLPAFPEAEYRFLGNTSLQAAEKICRDDSFRDGLKKMGQGVRVLDLSNHPDFNDLFIQSLDF